MTFPEAKDFIQSVGFPVAVAAFMLWDRLTIMTRLLRLLTKIEVHLGGGKTETDRLKEKGR